MTIFVIPDVHVPYHDKRAWAVCLEALKEVNPEKVVIIGDFADFYSVSQYSKDPKRVLNLKWEVARVNEELDKVSAKEVIFLEGNHEDRLRRYLQDKAPELFDMATIPELFHLQERGWTFIPYGDAYFSGKVMYVHDLGKAGKYAMFQTLDTSGMNTVFGHSHKGGIIYQGQQNSEGHFCMNVGWLGDYKKLDYIHRVKARREWRLGFGLVEEVNGLAFAEFVPIVKGSTCVRGKYIKP